MITLKINTANIFKGLQINLIQTQHVDQWSINRFNRAFGLETPDIPDYMQKTTAETNGGK